MLHGADRHRQWYRPDLGDRQSLDDQQRLGDQQKSKPLTPLCVMAGMALTLLLSLMPLAASPLADFLSAGMLKVGLTGDDPPYSTRDVEGAERGFDLALEPKLQAPGERR